jgi:uncharacterized protein YdhG (YjbR/CyaY superfamily)
MNWFNSDGGECLQENCKNFVNSMGMKTNTSIDNVDEYISGFPKDTQKFLKQLRATIIKAVPEAEEVISYQMPAYNFYGKLVYFAAYENHIGFYPTPSGIENFKKDLSGYKTSKGAVQFPINEPLPLPLISKIVAFRAKENLETAHIKGKIKKLK